MTTIAPDGGCVTGLPPAHNPWSDELEYDIAHFTLGVLYLQLLGLSIYNRLRRVNEKRKLWQQTFFVALALGIICAPWPRFLPPSLIYQSF